LLAPGADGAALKTNIKAESKPGSVLLVPVEPHFLGADILVATVSLSDQSRLAHRDEPKSIIMTTNCADAK
jgi:hypothetical protein